MKPEPKKATKHRSPTAKRKSLVAGSRSAQPPQISESGVPMGTILAFALSQESVPVGWLLCDGKEIPDKYTALRTHIGKYTPNLAGRALVGTGVPYDGPQSDGRKPNFDPKERWQLHNTGGEYQHTLTQEEMPSHAHLVNNGDFGLHDRPFKWGSGDDLPYVTKPQGRSLRGTDSTGLSRPHYTMQPYQVINYIIFTGDLDV